jgi:hypothetical protein
VPVSPCTGSSRTAAASSSPACRASPPSAASATPARPGKGRHSPRDTMPPRPALSLPPHHPRPLVQRKQPALGAKGGMRCGPWPKAQSQRPRGPRNPAKTNPQPALIGPPRSSRLAKTGTRRIVRRFRQNHPRPIAIALIGQQNALARDGRVAQERN